jgi:CarD family transcriptional regulator
MYSIGDMVVYGSTGVCRVTDITRPDFSDASDERLYYVLTPQYQNGVIYTPVDTKVFMREVITVPEIEALVSEIPTVEARGYYSSSVQLLTAYYETILKSYRCIDLAKLVLSIRAKKKELESQNRKLGQIDARFMKRAEELLFGELAVVLDLAPDAVPAWLEERISRE